MKHMIAKGLAAAVVVAITAAACGGGSSSTPTTPTTPTPPVTGTPSDTATITIGANGSISPSSVTITRGGRVTMVNNDTRNHDMASDPHPEHTQCTEINQIGFLTAGQQRTSGNFNTARTCGFHDHNLPDNAGLKGTIVIQ
jgi:plastocyanin